MECCLDEIFVQFNNEKTGEGFALYDMVEFIECFTISDVIDAFAKIKAFQNTGLQIAFACSFEMGYLLEPKLAVLVEEGSNPLMHLAVFRERQALEEGAVFTSSSQEKNLHHEKQSLYDCHKEFNGSLFHLTSRPYTRDSHFNKGENNLTTTKQEYKKAITKIKNHLLAGDIYQVNYTFKHLLDFKGNSFDLYNELRKRQGVKYAAYFNFPDKKILSLSPELFFEKKGSLIRSKPMKGTVRRGETVEEDEKLKEFLRNDPKNRSENLMIVDLIRNDLSRIGTNINVPKIFEVETYETVHQMTSTVEADIDPNLYVLDIMKAVFPCGSVTGAPKIRAMEIIKELEAEPRGIYTGALGYISPDNDMCVNVPIRTLVIDKEGRGELGIGSGVVYDSVHQEEFEECLLKAKFMTDFL